MTDFWYTRILDPKTQVVTGLTRNGLFLVEDGQVSQGVRNLRFTQSYAGAVAPGHVKAIAPDARLVNSSAFVPSGFATLMSSLSCKFPPMPRKSKR